MTAKALKVIGIWSTLLFLFINLSAFILSAYLGPVPGTLQTILISLIFAVFAGYKAASALAGEPGYEKKIQLVMVGASVALIAALISSVINYFMTGQIKYSAGLLLFASAIGGYLVNRKTTFSVPPQK